MNRMVFIALLALAMLFGSVAAADVIPPEVAACDSLEIGDACDGGICRNDTCSRLDYSQGSPPRTVTYDCVTCAPGSDEQGDSSTGTGESTAGESDQNAATGGDSGKKHGSENCSAGRIGRYSQTPSKAWLAGAYVLLLVCIRRRSVF